MAVGTVCDVGCSTVDGGRYEVASCKHRHVHPSREGHVHFYRVLQQLPFPCIVHNNTSNASRAVQRLLKDYTNALRSCCPVPMCPAGGRNIATDASKLWGKDGTAKNLE